MSGVAVLLRQRVRDGRRPAGLRRTRQWRADTMRAAALSVLRLPGLDQDGLDNANALLELVGETLTLPRHGWYPHAPRRRRGQKGMRAA